MPELPEVETIRLGLEKYVVGHKIVDVEVRLPRIVSGDPKKVMGATVLAIRRYGKGLVIDLDNGYSIAVHVKLTGQLVYKESKGTKETEETRVKVIKNSYASLPNQWTHVIFRLDKNAKLYYNDFRQFGWIKIVKSEEVASLPFFKDLGPEFPVLYSHPELVSGSGKSDREMPKQVRHDKKETLTLDTFIEILSKSGSPVKVVIMDQKKISGIGNIYANDGLNLARIDPQRKANSLSDKEIKTLYDALETVLKKGLESGGASELSYINVLGEEGKYQNYFLTYGRTGEKCFNCSGIIKRITLGGRGTFFCPACQK